MHILIDGTGIECQCGSEMQMILSPTLESSYHLTLLCPSCYRTEAYTRTDISARQTDCINAIVNYIFTKTKPLLDLTRHGPNRFSSHPKSQDTVWARCMGWRSDRQSRNLRNVIPLPKNYDFGGIVREVVPRYTHHFERWFDWFLHTIQLEQTTRMTQSKHPSTPTHATDTSDPVHSSHSVTATDEEQELILEEMYTDDLEPSPVKIH